MDIGTILEIVAIVVAAVVAIGVGVWQVKASRDQPRPQFRLGDQRGEGVALPAVVSNPGGAADKCHALARAGRDVYEYRGPFVAQLQNYEVSMTRLGEHSARDETEAPYLVWVVAADSRGRWWDVRRKRRIRKPINKWLLARSQAQQLPIPIEMG